VNEFLKCSWKTQKPKRTLWKLPAFTKHKPFFSDLKLTTGDRLFTMELRDKPEDTPASSQQKGPPLDGLKMYILDRGETMSKQELSEYIRTHGGTIADSITSSTNCIVSNSDAAAAEESDELAQAQEHVVPGVDEAFLKACVEKGEQQDMTPFLLWGEARKLKKAIAVTTTKFVEKNGVSMDSDVGDLGKKAHVLVDKTKRLVYSEMLSRTDMVTGGNSFYTLHLLESDADPHEYFLFRKWGRIGVSQGGFLTDEFSQNKGKAIQSFCKHFEERTGNRFGAAEFVVKPGKMLRVDVQHKALSAKAGEGGDGKGDAAGGDDQPLGKLSKVQIEKGDAVLDKIEGVLAEAATASGSPAGAIPPAITAKFQGYSAEYYSLIPHNFGLERPPVLNNAALLGAEKALLQFYLRMGFEDLGNVEEILTPISGVMKLPLPKSLHEAAKSVCGVKDIKSCTTKGAKLNAKKAGNPVGSMDQELYGSILLYTANAIYKQLNKALREENREEVGNYFPYLRLLFEACERLPQKKKTLWRGVGVGLYDSYKVGSVITWWGVSSCTSEEKVARDFMNGCGEEASLLTVETVTATDISELSFFSNEAESILLPGTQLEVLKSKKTGKKCEIHLKEVGRCVS